MIGWVLIAFGVWLMWPAFVDVITTEAQDKAWKNRMEHESWKARNGR